MENIGHSARVLCESPTEEEFHEIRRKLITGSDMAPIMGLSPYSTPYKVALEKKCLVAPFEETDETWAGKQAEPLIMALFERKTGKKARPNRSILAHREHEWAGGTPDGFTVPRSDAENVELVELKLVGVRASYDWGPPGSAEMPVQHFLQGMWYAGICGLTRCNLIGLLGSKGQIHPIEYDADMFAEMLRYGREFRDKYLLTDALPDPGAADLSTVGRLFPKSEEAELVETPEVRDLVTLFSERRLAFLAAKTRKEEVEARLKVAMGEKRRLKGANYAISWASNKDKTVVKYAIVLEKALAVLPPRYAKDLEKIIAQFTTQQPGARPFRPTGELFKGGDDE